MLVQLFLMVTGFIHWIHTIVPVLLLQFISKIPIDIRWFVKSLGIITTTLIMRMVVLLTPWDLLLNSVTGIVLILTPLSHLVSNV